MNSCVENILIKICNLLQQKSYPSLSLSFSLSLSPTSSAFLRATYLYLLYVFWALPAFQTSVERICGFSLKAAGGNALSQHWQATCHRQTAGQQDNQQGSAVCLSDRQT